MVLSRAFTENLVAKGVSGSKIELIYDPATRVPRPSATKAKAVRNGGFRILSMGNIGHSQGLCSLVRAFESFPELTGEAEFIVTGTGVAAQEANAEIRSDRVRMIGLVDDGRLEQELQRADVALVSQRYEGSEFNIPSKLMNFMAYGLPVVAAVNPAGEVARIITESGAGWVVDPREPAAFPREVARLSRTRGEIAERAASARQYADVHFTQSGFAERFEHTLRGVAGSVARA